MENLMALGLGMHIILGWLAGILIGASYSLYQKAQEILGTGQGLAGIVRRQGLFIAILATLWILLISYVLLKVKAIEMEQAAQTTEQAIQ